MSSSLLAASVLAGALRFGGDAADVDAEFGAPTQDALLTKLQSAISRKDKEAFLRLTHWTSLSETLRSRLKNTTPGSFSYKEASFRIEKISDEEKEPLAIGGKTYIWNVKPLAKVVIQDSGADQNVSMIFGTVNSRFYLASRVEKRSD